MVKHRFAGRWSPTSGHQLNFVAALHRIRATIVITHETMSTSTAVGSLAVTKTAMPELTAPSLASPYRNSTAKTDRNEPNPASPNRDRPD